MPFRPTLWATVFTIPTLAILIGLGTWQLDRLEWKRDLIETRSERIAMPPVGIDEALAAGSAGTLEGLEYRSITLRGTYLQGSAMRLRNRTMDGIPGVHQIAPLELAGGDGVVMVDRGWIPNEAETAPAVLPEGPVDVAGYLRLYREPGAFVPENDPDTDNWFYMDEAAMQRAAKADAPVGFYVQEGPRDGTGGRYPVGSVPAVDLRNAHLEYAVTWYGLAVVLAAIYVVFHWRRDRTDR